MSAARTASRLLIAPLSAAAGGPLYLQIVASLKREISEGRLEAGSALPSFRQLAEDLLVSVITVKRAYEELERDGIIYRRQGLGTFVSDAAADRSREVKTAHAAQLFRQGAREAAEAGLSQKAIVQLADAAIRQDADDHSTTHSTSHQGAHRYVRKRA
jgi:GntR family transcriptional regulator